jgi:oligopeptide/dipeptide ABC transporter ATP-binding protein
VNERLGADSSNRPSQHGPPLLEVEDLTVRFPAPGGGAVDAVDGVSFGIGRGEIVCIVGESGAGKSATALAILGLLPRHEGATATGRVVLDGLDLLGASERVLRSIRGRQASIVFQDPMTSLNPCMRTGRQVAETLIAHRPSLRWKDAGVEAVDIIGRVGIPDPEHRAFQYPHELSGGMRQRTLVAIAVANQPQLIVADEPTTALDVTIQAQVFGLLRDLQRETNSSVLLITHDLRVVAELADRVLVMYAGRIVESSTVEQLFRRPLHPYTRGLFRSLPKLWPNPQRLQPIDGSPPTPGNRPEGCAFHPRCYLSRARAECRSTTPELRSIEGADGLSACHFAEELDSPGSSR